MTVSPFGSRETLVDGDILHKNETAATLQKRNKIESPNPFIDNGFKTDVAIDAGIAQETFNKEHVVIQPIVSVKAKETPVTQQSFHLNKKNTHHQMNVPYVKSTSTPATDVVLETSNSKMSCIN